MELLAFPIVLAFLLGIKHSFDADHLVAVSSYLTRARRTRSAVRLGVYWALGHMVTAAAITAVLFTFKDIFLSQYLSSFESLVAIMLIAIGVLAVKDIRNLHSHRHSHGGFVHSHPHIHNKNGHHHKHMLGIGIVHGLASNDELLILITLSIGLSSILGLFVGIAVFSVGVIVGMVVFSAIMNTLAGSRGERFRATLVGGSGLLSIVYGTLMLTGIA